MLVQSVASAATLLCFHDGEDRAARSPHLSATCCELLCALEGVFASVMMCSGES